MAILRLADGRALDYAVTGPAAGTVLLFHHGTPSSVRQLPTLQRASAERGLRLVTYSRPGYGDSTRLPGRTVASAAMDTLELLQHLGLDRFLVAGWSGGGPHALATATLLPQLVAGVLTIAGVGPNDAPDLDFLAGMGEGNIEEFGLAAQGEAALRAGLGPIAEQMRSADPAAMADSLSSVLPDVDKAAAAGDFGSEVTGTIADGVRTGVDGWLDDDLAFLKPWGFSLEDLTVPAFLWQGSEDLMVPFAHGQWQAKHIPGVRAHLEQGHGHLSVLRDLVDPMLDELVSTL